VALWGLDVAGGEVEVAKAELEQRNYWPMEANTQKARDAAAAEDLYAAAAERQELAS
jgi:hypothetical protein